MRGTVTYINIEGGYGFIKVDGGESYFFHCTVLSGVEFDERLRGREMEFEDSTGRDGRARAIAVRPAEGRF